MSPPAGARRGRRSAHHGLTPVATGFRPLRGLTEGRTVHHVTMPLAGLPGDRRPQEPGQSRYPNSPFRGPVATPEQSRLKARLEVRPGTSALVAAAGCRRTKIETRMPGRRQAQLDGYRASPLGTSPNQPFFPRPDPAVWAGEEWLMVQYLRKLRGIRIQHATAPVAEDPEGMPDLAPIAGPASGEFFR